MARCMQKSIIVWIIAFSFFLILSLSGRNSTNPDSKKLKNDAQEALDAIGSTCTLKASSERAKQGQHVFNKGLLKFHRNVLKDLLKVVGGYDELENLMQDLKIPLSQPVKDAISTMVADFGSDEFYVDYNACVFGEYMRKLRNATVAYLKANTSVNENDGNGIQETLQRVQFIAKTMVDREVYVDPMACDHWLKHNQKRESRKKYNQVRDALKSGPMFQNILQAFQNVSDKIRDIRMSNSGKSGLK